MVLAIVAVLIIIALGIYLIYQGAPMYQQVYRTPQTQTTALGLRQIELRLRDYSFDPNTIVLKPGERVSIILVNEGRLLDRETIEGLIESGIDPAGEYGEYHTIVLDAPLFRVGIEILGGRVETIEGRFGDKIYRYRIYIPTRYRIYNKYQARGSYLLTT